MALSLPLIGQVMPGNMENVLTGGLTDQPDWTPSEIDQNTKALIDQVNQQGQMTPDQIASMQLQGVSPTLGSATGGAVAHQQATLGGNPSDSAAVNQALDERANRLYADQYNQLRNEAIAGAPARQGRLMSQAASALQAQQNINDELNRQQMEVTLQKWGMRNQIIGQLMSGAGSFAGTYAGMQGGRGARAPVKPPSTEGLNFNPTSDPNQPYNLTGDPRSTDAHYNLGVDTSMGPSAHSLNAADPGLGPLGYGYPGQPGNGYYGEPWRNSGNGSGLGVSYEGLQ